MKIFLKLNSMFWGLIFRIGLKIVTFDPEKSNF
jgi:hypothetical protein